MVDNLDLISETYSSEQLKNIEDKDNPLAPVNNFHSLAKSFMRQHELYNRELTRLDEFIVVYIK